MKEAGFQPITICTPIALMEDIQMKEVPEKHPEFDPETYTDPIFEECCCIVGFAIDPDETPVST